MSRPRVHFGPCSDPGCTEAAKVKGMCKKHYQKHRNKSYVPRLQAVRLRNTLLIQDRLESGDYDEQEILQYVKACRMSLSPQAS